MSNSEHIYVIDKAPHDWLFEQVAGIVHHGGSGTTGAALRSGRPSLIIPHMSDQPFWAKRVYELGVGAKPIPRMTLTADNLAAGVQTLLTDAEIQRAAAELGAKIRAENGVENAVRIITSWIEKQPTY
jgi:sterol 3beta-glucosyltransferase